MPKNYISRLLFEDRHMSHVLLEHGVGVRGGICFRKFENFLELVFCAVTTTEQLKGYGTMLMDFLKDWMMENEIYHVVTYADKFALGWFRKKGFTDKPQLDPKFYKNKIREYDGATLMGFDIDAEYLCKKYPYLSKRIRLLHTDSSPKNQVFKQAPKRQSPQFNPHPPNTDLDSKISFILEKLMKNTNSRPFRKPVDRKAVPDYYRLISNPMDLGTINERFQKKYYRHPHMFIADLTQIFKNCYIFNEENTVYYRSAYKLNALTLPLLKSAFPESKMYPELPKKKPIC